MRCSLLLLALLASPAVPAQGSGTPISLEQAMADPDWMGPPVEQAWWAWDSQRVHYTLKRPGSPLRDLHEQAASGGAARVLDEAGRSAADMPGPVYDRRRERMLFLRDGDVFLRDLGSGALTALTRTSAIEAEARFGSDGGVLWRVGSDWHR